MADGSLVDQRLLIRTPPEHDEERLRYFCVDRTPLPVIEQGVRWAIARHFSRRMRRPIILDCSAGEGGFHEVLKRLYPRSHRIAFEPRAECEEHLRRHAQEVHIGPFLDHEHQLHGAAVKAHIIAANPPFADGDERPLWMPFWRACADLLLPGGVLLLLGLNEIGQRGRKDHSAFETVPPTDQGRIAGPIKFRGASRGADMRCYSWWCRGQKQALKPRGEGWFTANLPWLAARDREWRSIPGHA